MTTESLAVIADDIADMVEFPSGKRSATNLARMIRIHCTAGQSCGTCAYANHDDASACPTLTFCTLKGGHYNGTIMERTSRCAKWEAAS